MTYKEAIQLLRITRIHSLEKNAEIAVYRLNIMNAKTPLKYKVACKVIIKAAENN